MTPFKRIRTRLGLSQVEIAEVLGMTQGNIAHYERGDQNVPPPVARNLIAYAKTKRVKLTFDDIYKQSETAA